MTEQSTFHNAVFAHWQGGITVFGFAYKTMDGIESGTGHHTRVEKAWQEESTPYFLGTNGRSYRVISWKRAEFSDASDAYNEFLEMAKGNHEN